MGRAWGPQKGKQGTDLPGWWILCMSMYECLSSWGGGRAVRRKAERVGQNNPPASKWLHSPVTIGCRAWFPVFLHPHWLGAHHAPEAGIAQPESHRPWRRPTCTRKSTGLCASTGFWFCLSHWSADPEHILSPSLIPHFMFFFLALLGVPKVPPQLCYSGKDPRLLSGLPWAVGPVKRHVGGCLPYKVKLVKMGNKVSASCDITLFGGV